jgi:type I restriction enzyme S subunit
MTQTQHPVTPPLQIRRWKLYPAYKHSGIEWLGEIPAHWELRRLKYVAPISTAKLVDKPEDLPYLGLEQIEAKTGRLLLDTPVENVESTVSVFEEGNVLFGKLRPYLAKVAHLNFSGVCTTELLVLQPDSTVEGRFLFYRLISESFIEFVNSMTYGTKMPRASSEQIGNSVIQLPPLPEQRAIAAFLDREIAKINTLISKKEQLIALLREKRTAIISQAVTKGLDPTVPMKNSGIEWLGKIPAHWKVRRIKYLASILRGKFSHRPRNDPGMYDGPYPFIQTGDITAVTKYITDYQQTLNETGYAVSKQFPSGTLIMAIAANIGDLAILQFPACFPDSIVGFVPISDIDLDYLYYNLTVMKPKMLSTATINTQLNLNVERIGGLLTVYPPMAEQQAIAAYLDRETAKIDALISVIEEGIKKLQEYSTALISATVTGKIDVREEI